MSAVAARLLDLGLVVPAVAAPVAAYVPAAVAGGLVFTAGQLPFVDGALPVTGLVGAEVSAEQAAEQAQLAALNAIAAVGSVVDLDDVLAIVKVTVFVASAAGFAGQPAVANGASELLGAAFGGTHARSAVGVAVLPLNAPVEVELVAELG